MPKTKAQKTYQKKYRRDHPEYDQNYKEKHWVLRLTFTNQERDRLRAAFGSELNEIARRLIRVELLKREFVKADQTEVTVSR